MNLAERPQRKAQVSHLFVKEEALQIEAETLASSVLFLMHTLFFSLVINSCTPPFALTKGHKTTHQAVGHMFTNSILDISLFKSASNDYMKSLGNWSGLLFTFKTILWLMENLSYLISNKTSSDISLPWPRLYIM